ncbi:MAG: dTMP kinase [Hyphomicrobiaceae bacterium]
MSAGRFITFEGGEGTGKSTQVDRLASRLEHHGISCLTTREPGGSAFAETIRHVVLDPATPPHPPLAEALLFSAARADHLSTVINPALAAGTWVICDRFADSTRAYQGTAGGLPAETLLTLETIVLGDTRPDLTIILDLPVDAAFARVMSRANDVAGNQAPDAFEQRDTDFHERLRRGFLDIAAAEPKRCRVIDAAPSADTIGETVWQTVRAHFDEVKS